jgi:hypothetical protein
MDRWLDTPHTHACTYARTDIIYIYISFIDSSSMVILVLFLYASFPYTISLVQCVEREMSVIYIATTTFPAYFLSIYGVCCT